jgi:hypothetical protein
MDAGDDHDMSLSALLRLRNRNWGGGGGSSLPSSCDASPRSEHARKPSGISVVSEGDEDVDARIAGFEMIGSSRQVLGSPVHMTPREQQQHQPQQKQQHQAPISPLGRSHVPSPAISSNSPGRSATVGTSPSNQQQQQRVLNSQRRSSAPVSPLGHRHNASAGSISYKLETDADGMMYWVVERNGADGEVEVIGREVVSGI